MMNKKEMNAFINARARNHGTSKYTLSMVVVNSSIAIIVILVCNFLPAIIFCLVSLLANIVGAFSLRKDNSFPCASFLRVSFCLACFAASLGWMSIIEPEFELICFKIIIGSIILWTVCIIATYFITTKMIQYGFYSKKKKNASLKEQWSTTLAIILAGIIYYWRWGIDWDGESLMLVPIAGIAIAMVLVLINTTQMVMAYYFSKAQKN